VSIFLRVAYDGTDFHGFARQADRPDGTPTRTVQGQLEATLAQLYGQPVLTRGASRTDAGVHARGQLVAFDPPLPIPADGVAKAVAGRLPPDVAVTAAWIEPVGDPRRDNLGKHYRYRIRCTRAGSPLTDRFAWPYGRRLDGPAMHAAAQVLVGEHDFASFRAAGCQAATTVRHLSRVEVRWMAAQATIGGDPGALDPAPRDDDWVEIDVEGTAFLYNMVRIIAGSLVEVGRGRHDPAWIRSLLSTPDRNAAGPTAPACGLTLMEVRWPHAQTTRGAAPQGGHASS
jgi:tRNA pseudouridine38-40 synthase